MRLFEVTVAEAVRRARALGPRAGLYVHHRFDAALAQADAPTRGSLAGVPYGLKDEFDTPDLPTTGGSWRHRHRTTPGFKSAPFRAFEAAGAVLLGKSNLSDLGIAPEATSHVGGSTLNPYDPKRTAGGSSGGSAAAVALGVHGFDWGTDIGGSIRLPAAFCGVLGLKLSDETWPIQELFPPLPKSIRWMCGQGPFTRTLPQMRAVLDAAEPVLRAKAGEPFVPRGFAMYAPVAGRWPTFTDDVQPVLEAACGLPVGAADLPAPSKILRTLVSIWASHFMDLLPSDPDLDLRRGVAAAVSAVVTRGRLGDRRLHPLTAELLLLFAASRLTWATDRDKCRSRAFAVADRFRSMWAAGRVVVAPVVAHPPPKLGTSTRNLELLQYTAPGNLADATGLAIPFGRFEGRWPRALQLLGPPGSERVLMGLAERLVAVRDRQPELQLPPPIPPD